MVMELKTDDFDDDPMFVATESIISTPFTEEVEHGGWAILYHRTPAKDLIKSVIEEGFHPSGGNGSMYGVGWYFTQTYEMQHDSAMTQYGEYIVKARVPLHGMLIFDMDKAKMVYGDNFQLHNQIKMLCPEALELFNNDYKLLTQRVFNREDIDYYKTKGHTSGLAECWFDYFSIYNWYYKKIKGLEYYGYQNGYCVVAYDFKDIIPLAIESPAKEATLSLPKVKEQAPYIIDIYMEKYFPKIDPRIVNQIKILDDLLNKHIGPDEIEICYVIKKIFYIISCSANVVIDSRSSSYSNAKDFDSYQNIINEFLPYELESIGTNVGGIQIPKSLFTSLFDVLNEMYQWENDVLREYQSLSNRVRDLYVEQMLSQTYGNDISSFYTEAIPAQWKHIDINLLRKVLSQGIKKV